MTSRAPPEPRLLATARTPAVLKTSLASDREKCRHVHACRQLVSLKATAQVCLGWCVR